MTKILYKYKSLQNFKFFVDIILKKRLYASKYKDLNDPMEGQYYYREGELRREIKEIILSQKNEYRICSLSRINNNELMWSHYADGQRGVAVGVKIDDTKYLVRQVQYNGLSFIREQNYNQHTVIDILSHKLEVWSYEQEERVFVKRKNFIEVNVIEIITGRAMSNQDYSFLRELIEKIDPKIRIIKAETLMN